MTLTSFLSGILYPAFLVAGILACGQQQGGPQKHKAAAQERIPYELDKPRVFQLPPELDEISGISLLDDNPVNVWAEQDEEGKVYRLRLGSPQPEEVIRFGKKGDYEDIQVSEGRVVFMLRSDGTIYIFPLQEGKEPDPDQVQKYKNLLPSGEYEGLGLVSAPQRLVVLCKKCSENNRKKTTVYYFNVVSAGLEPAGSGEIDVEEIARLAGVKKLSFEPSAFAWHSGLGRWFILSSVNKMLVVTDKDLKPLAVHPLDPALYNQPEGIAFDSQYNLFISNEKGSRQTATLLRIPYRNTP